jgi:hypothetical protein
MAELDSQSGCSSPSSFDPVTKLMASLDSKMRGRYKPYGEYVYVFDAGINHVDQQAMV